MYGVCFGFLQTLMSLFFIFESTVYSLAGLLLRMGDDGNVMYRVAAYRVRVIVGLA